MSKQKSAPPKFSINWVATSVFVLACVGLLTFSGGIVNLWLHIESGLSLAWNLQIETWHSLTSDGLPAGLFTSLSILTIILMIEHFRPWRKLQKRFRKEFWLDVVYNIFSFGLYNLIGLGAAYALILSPFEYFLASEFNVQYPLVYLVDEVPMWARLVLLVLCSEFVAYWAHRLEHNVNFLWQFHKIHHSALELDVMNAQRLHWLESLWLAVTGYVALGIIGFNVAEIALMNFFTFFLCYFTHANVYIPIGKLKYIINSPQMHIWHHSIDIDPNRNVNYGSALSIWDWIFETAYFPEKVPEDLKLGFEGVEVFPKSFLGQFIYPFRVFGEKLLHIFIVPCPVNTSD